MYITEDNFMEEGGKGGLLTYYVVRYVVLYERILYFVSLMIAATNTHTHTTRLKKFFSMVLYRFGCLNIFIYLNL